MDMKKYLAALQAKEATQQANFGDDADTASGMLCSTYYELNATRTPRRSSKPLTNSIRP